MKVVDLVKDPQPILWQACVDAISQSRDPLRGNYSKIKFDEFLSFPAVVDQDQIVCFSGLQYSERKWGQGIARASSRMWIHPEYRHPGLTKYSGGAKFLNTTYCLPRQFAVAKENNIDCIFISRETNPRGFEQYLKLIEINCNYKFTLLSYFYNVCGPQIKVPESCRQYVAVHYATEQGHNIWQDTMDDYRLTECLI